MSDKSFLQEGGVRLKWIDNGDGTHSPLVAVAGGGGGGGGPVTVDDITDATVVGKAVMKAADAAAARDAIGAVIIGTTATTAKAGNYQPTWAQVTGKPATFAPTAATASAIGGVKTAAAPTITITDPVDDENVQAAFDALILALKTSGVLT